MLIDVSVLKEWVENWFTKNRLYHPYAKNNNIPITELYDILEQMPSAQPEIIRCKDCKHRPDGDGFNHHIVFPDGICPCQCSDDEWYSWAPKDDWFCAEAERREDG